MPSTRPDPRILAGAGYLVAGGAVLVALSAWEGRAYVEYSDGVYVYTAHAIGGAARLYRDVAAAQPPGIFWLGGAVLAIHDSIGTLRAALGGLALVQGGLVVAAVWRLTASAPAATLGGLASLLTPWSLREHATLVPETVGSPVLMAAALLAARPRWAAAAGALGALSVAVKVSFVLPAVAIGAAAARRPRYAAGLLGGGAALLVVFVGLYDGAVWDNVVTAQLQSGSAPARYVAQLWGQAAWNELPLVLVGLGAWLMRDRVGDPALLRTLLALLLAAGVLLISLAKSGTYLQVVVLLEAPAVALAATTVMCGLRAAAETPSQRPGAVAAGVAVTAALGLTAAQSASVLASPTHPRLLARPWASSGPSWELDRGEVAASVRAARACPPDTAYSGQPYVAYVAGRRMPGGQPDQFITAAARVHERFLRAAQADRARCP